MPKLDHIMYAVPDLDQGVADIAALTGVTPAYGGAHPGRGTCNALLSLGPDQYLEIIAPDVSQDLAGTLGEEMIQRGTSGVRAWAVATDDLTAVADAADKVGLPRRSIIDMSRTTPEGVHLAWQLLFLTGGTILPFFIDWQESPHPATATPTGCELLQFTVTTPEDATYRNWMAALGIPTDVVSGPDSLSAVINTPKGRVELPAW